ncbi:unnamed protein product [Prorocentrum cordatum]|uniref:Uncharacterized protein n=1 Tax=Prorocentrum cordatum TaxID=2364126 RepID=A0ABN9VMB6_9DINO|nr:unnamed protein product [Polarella glacialis]
MSLGVHDSILEFLVSHRIFRAGEKLVVSDSSSQHGGFLEELSAALLGLWKFVQFSESRWLTVGRACRPITCGFLSGLDLVCQRIIEMPHTSTYYIGGFRRILPNVHRRFILVASLTTWLPDEIFQLLLRDDRLMKQIDAVTEAMDDEFEYLCSMSSEVYDLLAVACPGMSGFDLRCDVLGAAHVLRAFIWFRSLRKLNEYPLCLAMGDVRANVGELLQGDEPDEDVAARIWRLGRKRLAPLPRIWSALELLKETSFSTRIVEQMHAHAAVHARFHPEYDLETVRVRAFCSLVNALMPSPTADEKAFDKERATLERLRAKRPRRLNARSLYIKDLIELCTQWRAQGKIKRHCPNLQQDLLAKGAAMFQNISAERRREYDAVVVRAQAEAIRATSNSIEESQRRLAELTERHEKAMEALRAEGPPLTLVSAKLSTEQAARLEGAFGDQRQLRDVDVLARRAAVQEASMPGAAFFQALGEMPVAPLPESSRPAPPSWASRVAQERASFRKTVFKVTVGTDELYLLFLFAMQSPATVVFARLNHAVRPALVGVFNMEALDAASGQWPIEFTTDFAQFVSADDLPDVPASDVAVLTGARYLGGAKVGARSGWQPLDAMLGQFPPRPAAPKKEASEAWHEDLSKVKPYLKRFLEQARSEPSSASARPEGADDHDDFGVGALSDEDLDELFAALSEARQLIVDTVEVDEDFHVNVLGGLWTMVHRGVSHDAYQGTVIRRQSQASKFAVSYGFQAAQRFNVTLYGEEGALTLAQAWVRKSQFYYNIWKAQPLHDYIFSAAELRAWEPPPALVALIERLPPGRARSRAVSLRDFRLARP